MDQRWVVQTETGSDSFDPQIFLGLQKFIYINHFGTIIRQWHRWDFLVDLVIMFYNIHLCSINGKCFQFNSVRSGLKVRRVGFRVLRSSKYCAVNLILDNNRFSKNEKVYILPDSLCFKETKKIVKTNFKKWCNALSHIHGIAFFKWLTHSCSIFILQFFYSDQLLGCLRTLRTHQ